MQALGKNAVWPFPFQILRYNNSHLPNTSITFLFTGMTSPDSTMPSPPSLLTYFLTPQPSTTLVCERRWTSSSPAELKRKTLKARWRGEEPSRIRWQCRLEAEPRGLSASSTRMHGSSSRASCWGSMSSSSTRCCWLLLLLLPLHLCCA